MVGTREIAEFVINTPGDAVPPQTIDAVERSCFDSIGVALAGSTQPVGQKIRKYSEARGGNPEATTYASGFRTSAPEAALANGTMSHALDYDDFGAYGHPTVPLLPALLAMGEVVGASGEDVLTSYAIGFEVGNTVYRSYDQYSRGFHSTPIFGTLAAAAGCARLLGLSVDQTMVALGIAASEASGVGRNNGTMTKPLHAGLAARNGVMAALLAAEGMTAAPDIFEAKQGFCETFLGDGRYDMREIVEQMGNPFRAQDTLMIKKYPCCGGNHSALDAVFKLLREHNLTYDDIESVEVQEMTYTSPVLRYPEPPTGLNAKFSIHHAVAAAIKDGEVRIDHFTDECAVDPVMKEARAKVHAEVMPRWDPRFMYGHHDANPVQMRLKNGEVVAARVGRKELLGSPTNPLSEADLVKKFRDNVALVFNDGPTVDSVTETWRNFRSIGDVREAVKTLSA